MLKPKKYLLWCVNDFVDMRLPELEALCSLFGLKKKFLETPSEKPYLIIESDSESRVRQMMSRSLLVKFALELWGDGTSKSELKSNLLRPEVLESMEPYRNESFRMVVDSFGKAALTRELREKIDWFEFLPLKGKVCLKNPTLKVYFYEYFGLDPNNVPPEPYRMFVGRWIADGQKRRLATFNLRDRLYIGNTSMDPNLAFIMANLARVQPGDLVYDPFVGSGSILVSAAEFGATVVGADIDYLTVHAETRPSRVADPTSRHGKKTYPGIKEVPRKRAENESIRGNFEQYGLGARFLDAVIADAAASDGLWRARFDAIVTDPPYGIREGTRRIGDAKEDRKMEVKSQGYIPSRVKYELSRVYADLLERSSKQLVVGGRLVFFIPVIREDYTPEIVPEHSCFALIANCEQVLTSHTSRRLIVMEKIREPEDGDFASVPDMHDFAKKYFAGSKSN